ncbi:Fis family transcriptional regulator [Nocardiopsis sp. TSRI0078]|uniref:PucR family transcriptional regulator n=1 Tax=unclassified Nocardiopsis TaxID=2649073 RepID=UPI00093D6C92|nr:PucR family transcriptional regulator [Nocardiopsis sp. TSRI0078]OKI12938.1 Fis family transcriptional regulator [Nocardiopsis sp. TSRI0078]
MAITVRDIAANPALEVRVAAGGSGLDRVVRWAHVIELRDPVRWLRGGELVLTVGLGLGSSEEERRAYVRRLHGAGCVGLAFAIDVWMSGVPPEVLAEGDALGLPVLRVEGDTPFIAVVEAVADHYAAERTREQQRVLTAQDAMARAALRSGPTGVMGELSSATSGASLLLDRNGMTSTAVPDAEPPWHALVRSALAGRPRGMTVLADGDATVLLQTLGPTGRTLGWLALHCPFPVTPHVRVLANHAASLLAVDLLHSRDARRALYRERAPVLLAAVTGRSRAPLTLPAPPWEVVCFRGASPAPLLDQAADALTDVLGDTEAARRSGLCVVDGALVAVLPDTGGGQRLGRRLFSVLSGLPDAPRAAGACGARGPDDLPSAVERARQTATEGYRHADESDAWSLLRSSVPPEGARAFDHAVLGRLRAHDARNGTDLAHTLRHYLDNSSQVEATARDLGVHRNTLRSRLRVAERVMGRTLDEPRTRLELWTALSLEPMRCHDGTWHA